MADAPAIRIANAAKTYPAEIGRPARAVVHDISITVEPGTVHGLLGPNGAGKTTTLKMLIGLVRPTAGTFEILGQDARRPSGRARLGFLPEQPYFNPQLTADQVLALSGRLLHLPEKRIKEQGAELLDEVGLDGQGHTVIGRFSRGMLQRLGIAQAMLGDPAVLVLDEPASGLDPVGQRDVRNIMVALAGRGVSILLSSHQLSEVEAVSDRVTIVNAGRVAAHGRIEDLLKTAGRTSVRARGVDALPASVAALTDDMALSAGNSWVFSIPEESTRLVVDALDDAGATIESIAPKRESLEDYFSRMMTRDERDRATAGGEG